MIAGGRLRGAGSLSDITWPGWSTASGLLGSIKTQDSLLDSLYVSLGGVVSPLCALLPIGCDSAPMNKSVRRYVTSPVAHISGISTVPLFCALHIVSNITKWPLGETAD